MNDLETGHVLQLLDKRQFDLILRNDAKHLLPAREEPQCFTLKFTQDSKRLPHVG